MQVADLMGPGLLDCFLFREKILQPLQLSNITNAWNVLICNSHVSTVSRTLNIPVGSLTICLLKMEDSHLRKLLVVIGYHWLSRFTSVWKKGNHCELLRLHVNMLINMLNNIEIYYFPKLEKKLSTGLRKERNDLHNTNQSPFMSFFSFTQSCHF